MQKEFIIKGMSCQNCVKRITNVLTNQEEIAKVDIDLETGKLKLELKEDLSANKIITLIEDLGYEVEVV